MLDSNSPTIDPLAEVQNTHEEALINDLKLKLRAEILRVCKRVNQSALHHMVHQKQWVAGEHEEVAQTFFVDKIPQVMADELSKSLHSILGV
ncbi:MAG: hypothetical protein AAB066_03410 [Candidatus Margulisiibacteriota bacterium]